MRILANTMAILILLGLLTGSIQAYQRTVLIENFTNWG